ncbi:hypothetical protein [Ramlibacter alkalitolerans]|jgi:hypothetical protein|uniref:Uncharacterized protein n=1 Tax=Ramlibacter alkalitolerans TaxID=2039631 RepID=A0ABS1JRB5_9BURK|nr:hypothetical protein [Ramlibacter alkalitolerans]MBL0426787.1 hypothetical protein [Ramlibacter alkalitolerans]
MNEQLKSMESPQPPAAAQPGPGAETQKPMRTVSDPREVAALVMQRMQHVSAKKDELDLAIKGLVDITKQLTRTYGEQLIAVEHLRRRVKALEAAAAGTAASGTPMQ